MKLNELKQHVQSHRTSKVVNYRKEANFIPKHGLFLRRIHCPSEKLPLSSLSSGSQLWLFASLSPPPQEHVAASGDICSCHIGREVLLASVE